jgi:hypothetical protein
MAHIMSYASNVFPLRTPSNACKGSHDQGVSEEERQPNEFREHGHWTAKNRPLTNPMSQLGIMRQFFRVWYPHFTLAERNILGFILDLTAGWGERSRRFTHREIETGTGVKKSQSYAVLRSLHSKGPIFVDDEDVTINGTMIYVNLEWNPKVAARVTNPPVRMRKRPAAPIAKIAPPVGAIERTLRSAFKHNYANTPVAHWVDSQRFAVARCIADKWPATEHEAALAHEFANWLVTLWAHIRKVKEAPEYPEADFLNHNSQWLLREFQRNMEHDRSSYGP